MESLFKSNEKYPFDIYSTNVNSLDEDGADQGIAATTFPAPLDIADLVTGQFSLGISQIFWVPENGFSIVC